MDPDHPTVLSTLESLGEACLDARRFSHALKYYNELFDRSQSSGSMSKLKQASILHKIATIYEHQDDPKAQKEKLEFAMRFIRSEDTALEEEYVEEERKTLETKIQEELQRVQEELTKNEENWV
jgi:hypothetical protein